ncbi:MAG: ABC transporter permease [Candidatus Aenigmatarchaeota archaeon]
MITDIYTIWLREMIRFARARSRIISSLAMPFFWLALVGIGFSSSFKLLGMDYMNFLAPGIVGMMILFTSIFSGVSVIWDRQFGFLKEILVAPVSRTSIVLGKTLGGATVALINGLIMLVIAVLMGVLKLSAGIFPAILFMLLTAVCFVSIGLIIASQMKSMEGFQMIMSFLVMPIFFLSGALFPLENTPLWMQTISHLDPLTYGIDGLRGSLVGMNMFPVWMDLAALVVFSGVLVLIGSWLFRRSVM